MTLPVPVSTQSDRGMAAENSHSKQRSLFDCGLRKVQCAEQSAAYVPLRLDKDVVRSRNERVIDEAGARERLLIERWQASRQGAGAKNGESYGRRFHGSLLWCIRIAFIAYIVPCS